MVLLTEGMTQVVVAPMVGVRLAWQVFIRNRCRRMVVLMFCQCQRRWKNAEVVFQSISKTLRVAPRRKRN